MTLTLEVMKQQLARYSGFQYDLLINENRSALFTILDRRANWAKLSLHRMFLDAPTVVLEAIATYVRALDKSSLSIIRSYIKENFHRFNYSHRLDRHALRAKGKVYDLKKIFNDVNEHYFDKQVDLEVTWFTKEMKKNCSRIVYGLYYQSLRLIKINQMLDDAAFPDFFVNYVVYHEMLHHVVPTYIDEKGVARIHSKEFKEREKQFLEYERAREWELGFRYRFFDRESVGF